MGRRGLGFQVLVLAVVLAVPVFAQDPASTDLAVDNIADARASLAAEISALRERLPQAGESPELAAQIASEIELLERLDNLELQQQNRLHQTAQLAKADSALEERLAAGDRSSIRESPPYALAVFDTLADAIEAHARQTTVLARAAESAEEAARDASEQEQRAAAERRRAKETVAAAEGEAQAARARRDLRVAALEQRIAAARGALAEAERSGAELSLSLQRKSGALIQLALDFVEQHLALGPEARRDAMAVLERDAARLRTAREAASRQLESAKLRLDSAEKRLDDDPSPGRMAEVDARRAALETAQLRLAIRGQQEGRSAERRVFRERRLQVLADEVSRTQMVEWERDLELRLREFRRQHEVEEGRSEEARRLIRVLEQRIDGIAQPSKRERRALESHVAELRTRRDLHDEGLSRLRADLAAGQRTGDAIRSRTANVTLADRAEQFKQQVEAVWNTELTTVEDRAITIGKVATALLLLVIGIALASFLSRVIGRVLKRRLEMEEGAAVAFQSLGYYLLVLIFFLFALNQANIPLTAFTILGGAFAIGIGFGSQTLISNFISGLILLVERPIKVGDMVDIDNTLGVVEQIGLRSTRIRTFDNSHIIVPNSSFLEKNVLNWNLTDDIVRGQVNVGVAYGSATRDVERLIMSAAESHERVLDDPVSSVLFLDFGASSLDFRLYFWIRMRDLIDRRRIESDLRHEIDALFREAGIVIAFPQREVHLNTSAPIEFRLTGGDSG